MSRQNIEMVRRGIDAYGRRDVEGILEDWADDAVLDWSKSRGLEAGVYRGLDEIRAFIERFLEAFEEIRIVIEDVRESEDGALVVENVAHFRGRDGIEVRARSAWLLTFQGGKQTSLTLYQEPEEAFEAATGRD